MPVFPFVSLLTILSQTLNHMYAGEISSIEISYEQRFIIRAICYVSGVNKNIGQE